MKKATTVIFATLFILSCSLGFEQNYQSDLDIKQRYDIYLPKELIENPQKPVSLLIFLHGRGEMGDSLNELSYVRVHGPLHYIDKGNELPFIVVAPQLKRKDRFWNKAIFDAVLKDVEKKYPVDQSRIYLTGISLGGYGTWYLTMTYPEKFAAIAPMAGGDIFKFNVPGIGKDMSAICNIKDVPAWVVHGDKDPVVPADDSKRMVAELKKCGANVKFTLYKDKRHISWKEMYADPEFYAWLQRQKKPGGTGGLIDWGRN